METKFIRALVALGVPGVALGVFFLLMRAFSFSFSQITPGASAGIAVLFVVVVGGITLYALHRWAPNRSAADLPDRSSAETFRVAEEVVTYTELLRSVAYDVVKVHAHSHSVGVAAEYAWIDRHYPDSTTLTQSLSSLRMLTKQSKGMSAGDLQDVYFDIVRIRLHDGREKDVYFDISTFFNGGPTDVTDLRAAVAHRLEQLYASADQPARLGGSSISGTRLIP